MLHRLCAFAPALAFTATLTVALSALFSPQALARKPKPEPAPSPLGTFPAKVEYVSNDAPFVVFDVSPRSLDQRSDGLANAELAFVATDALHRVTVFTYTSSPQRGTREMPVSTACGAKIAGYHRCAVPLSLARAHLQGGAGEFGMRIEAEGLDGERSTVLVTLPVKGTAAAKPGLPSAPDPAASPAPLSLTFVTQGERELPVVK